ncbi:MAG: fused MFS/spermidine synthase, partial [Candidatus Omnitrophota bacterium]|nr:fused MFS/spermidine synthase [Candidatus Omnitrophota bacterium]
IYLLSFVLVFKRKMFCPRWVISRVDVLLGLGILLYFALVYQIFPIVIEAGLLLGILFFVCLYCQHEIYRSKPTDSNDLTFFYFVIALGGCAGGIVTAWILPLISSSLVEFIFGLFLIALTRSIGKRERILTLPNIVFPLILLNILMWAPRLALKLNYFHFAGLLVVIIVLFILMDRNRTTTLAALGLIVVFLFRIEPQWLKLNYVYSHRNYYGLTRILEQQNIRFLLHGTTIHGAQITTKRGSFLPLTYYTPNSPAAEILINDKNLKDVAIIGLGTGALSVYLEKNQRLDYYEIDPDIVEIAQQFFTYLSMAKSPVEFIVGDARQSLASLPNKKYDLIIIDAFSGDSIPTHLLTAEALELYRRHLTAQGMLLFHVTNRYIHVAHPLFKTAFSQGGLVGFKRTLDNVFKTFTSDWVLVTWSSKKFQHTAQEFNWMVVNPKAYDHLRAWSDQYSNIIPFIKFPLLLKM